MSRKRVESIEGVHRQFLKHEKPLPSDHWFETYRKGDAVYVTARWGWQHGGNRGSRNLGAVEIVIPYLIDNLDLVGLEGRKSLGRLTLRYLPHLHNEVVERIERLRLMEANNHPGAMPIPRWEGGCLLQYVDWEMIDRAVFG